MTRAVLLLAAALIPSPSHAGGGDPRVLVPFVSDRGALFASGGIPLVGGTEACLRMAALNARMGLSPVLEFLCVQPDATGPVRITCRQEGSKPLVLGPGVPGSWRNAPCREAPPE